MAQMGARSCAAKGLLEESMSEFVRADFAPLAGPKGVTYVVFVGPDLKLSPRAAELAPAAAGLVTETAKTARFSGKALTALDILAPPGLDAPRLLVVGVGKDAKEIDFAALGGFVMGRLGGAEQAFVLFSAREGEWGGAAAGDFLLGLKLRAYRFDKYKTKKKDDDENGQGAKVTIGVSDVAAARRAGRNSEAIAEGVELARNLVNEPPNILFPQEFAKRAGALAKLGVQIDTLDEKAMTKLGMGSLLGVGQGSERESRLVVMRWNGAKGAKAAKPVAFIGKGVCFDTGGISIKPAAGMEDMKGDMAGAACVVGLMHALASRKAKVNAIGAIGLVENMPDGKAIRPGDILTSMSGQTIEVINTDAEGRLVLADVLWYVQDRFKPKFMINLATLTGAIIVSLGQEYAGLFANDDKLVERLSKAGEATGERVWRMPLGPEYDKMIDSKFADMKNTGGRWAGSITAAQLLQRFVGKTPWAHLDIAGTALGSPQTDINKSWSSG